KFSAVMMKITSNQKFDVAIMTIILLNMLTMALEHYEQPDEMTTMLSIINSIFIAIFSCECLMKLAALRIYYFKEPWNVFDFCVVALSILGTCLAMKEIIEKYFFSPTLLRVVRVFRVGRILRLVKSAKGIRTLLFSLAVSLPALFNIGLLLFLIMFIYAIFGMSFFMHVKYNAGIEELFNFETFGKSMTLLFQISTSAGWDSVLAGIMIEAPYCNQTFTENSPNGNCGSKMMGVIYLVTYLVISYLVVVNMYIAVILENFSQATEDVQQGLTQDDFDMYYEVWGRFDEKATQYIPLTELSTLVDSLEKPLRIPKPNLMRLTYLDIPICAGGMVHCIDILDALTKNFLAYDTNHVQDLQVDMKGGPVRVGYAPVSSTMKWKRMDYCARIIQRAWRDYLKNRINPDKTRDDDIKDGGYGNDDDDDGDEDGGGHDDDQCYGEGDDGFDDSNRQTDDDDDDEDDDDDVKGAEFICSKEC
ncbi:hypothetical protein HELRODRAFT_87061, partial [Helobdella robusta]|uniref:Sodium channel protein n=1 Tax=Helobdella robusta TaxID=6412 RepID=T1G6L3_HELRO